MPALWVAGEETRAGVMGTERGWISAFCLDEKGGNGIMDAPQVACSLTEGLGPLGAACYLGIVVDCVGGLGCPCGCEVARVLPGVPAFFLVLIGSCHTPKRDY